MNKQISAKDLELLSSYLDHQLSPSDKKHVESRLAVDVDFQNTLAGLRRTKYILRTLPQRSVPRNFTIPLQEKKSRFDPFQYFRVFRFSSAAAVLGLLILLMMDFLLPGLKLGPVTTKQPVQVPAAAASIESPTEAPNIIFWSTQPPYASGRGGGGADLPTGPAAADVTSKTEEAPVLLDRAKKAPSESLATPQTEQSLQTLPASPQPPESTQATESVESGTGPILGIPPSSERGVVPTPTTSQSMNDVRPISPLRLPEIILALIAILSGLVALILYGKLR
jgi:hypothetical protein